jgi:hypothetical protein
METSNTIKELATALCQFQASQIKVAKTATNPAFKSKYANITSVLDAVLGDLTEVGLSVVQFPDGEHSLTTRLQHISGEYMQATYPLKPSQATPQGVGSAMTYARRYALVSILGLGTEDDDGNAASVPGPPAPAAAAQPVSKPLAPESRRLIEQLLAHPTIQEDERTRTLAALNNLDHETGKTTISVLTKRIKDRGGEV